MRGRCANVDAQVSIVAVTAGSIVVKVTRVEGEMYESSLEDPGAMGTACFTEEVTTRVLALPRGKRKGVIRQLRHVVKLPAPDTLDSLPESTFPVLKAPKTGSKELAVKACGKSLGLAL